MMQAEFLIWIKFHFARFPSVEAWLAKFAVEPAFEGQPTQLSVLDAWRDVLRDASLDDAKRASQLLAVGDEQFLDRSFESHPRTVRMIARRLAGERRHAKRRTIDGDEAFDCPDCRDTGWRVAWHHSALRVLTRMIDIVPGPAWRDDPRWRAESGGGRVYESCAMRCGCAHGERHRDAVVFDSSRHVEFKGGDVAFAIAKIKAAARTPHPLTGLSPEF